MANTIKNWLVGAAALAAVGVVASDAAATDIPDTLNVFGACCGGQSISTGFVPGTIEYGLWLSGNAVNNGIKQANLFFRNSMTTIQGPSPNGIVDLGTSNAVLLRATAADGTGKVGVGTLSPAQPLDVAGRIMSREMPGRTAGLWLGDSGGVQRQFVGARVHSATGALQEAGFYSNGAWRFTFRGDGQAFKADGGAWSSLSDARVKKNVHDFEPGLREVEELRPVTFEYNGLAGSIADGKQHVGVIAQETERVAPYVVSTTKQKLSDKDAREIDVKTVNPSAFTYMLINAVQELSRQNRELKAAVCDLNPKSKVCSQAPSSK